MSAVLETNQIAPTTEVFQNGQILDARLISVKEYDRMIQHGILTTGDKVELLNGIIVKKIPKGIKHAALNDLAGEIFRGKLGNRVVVRNQNPIVLDDFSEPEPDLVLAEPPRERYFENHPTPEEVLLIVEISDTTLGRDRFAKGSAYAKAGIRQYLVLNVQDQMIEDYRQPSAGGYGSKQTYRRGESLDLVAFPGTKINVDDLIVS